MPVAAELLAGQHAFIQTQRVFIVESYLKSRCVNFVKMSLGKTYPEFELLNKSKILCMVAQFQETGSVDYRFHPSDTLFPYVRSKLEEYLKTHWENAEFQLVLGQLKEQAKKDEEDSIDGVVSIPESDKAIEAVAKNVLWQMDLDRKTKSLKQLQGHIWRDGYKNGDIKGHLYDDVVPALKLWTQSGRQLYIYSSGSVEAQKLLFGHSQDGDLLELFSGYFDTEVGPKVEADSYKNIVERLHCEAEDVVFFTDVSKGEKGGRVPVRRASRALGVDMEEAKAAKEAGLNAVLVVREGNAPLSSEDKAIFPVITSFQDFVFEVSAKRQKLSSDGPSEMEVNRSSGNMCESEDVEMVDVSQAKSREENVSITTQLDILPSNDTRTNQGESQIVEMKEEPIKIKTDETESKTVLKESTEKCDVVSPVETIKTETDDESKALEILTDNSNFENVDVNQTSDNSEKSSSEPDIMETGPKCEVNLKDSFTEPSNPIPNLVQTAEIMDAKIGSSSEKGDNSVKQAPMVFNETEVDTPINEVNTPINEVDTPSNEVDTPKTEVGMKAISQTEDQISNSVHEDSSIVEVEHMKAVTNGSKEDQGKINIPIPELSNNVCEHIIPEIKVTEVADVLISVEEKKNDPVISVDQLSEVKDSKLNITNPTNEEKVPIKENLHIERVLNSKEAENTPEATHYNETNKNVDVNEKTSIKDSDLASKLCITTEERKTVVAGTTEKKLLQEVLEKITKSENEVLNEESSEKIDVSLTLDDSSQKPDFKPVNEEPERMELEPLTKQAVTSADSEMEVELDKFVENLEDSKFNQTESKLEAKIVAEVAKISDKDAALETGVQSCEQANTIHPDALVCKKAEDKSFTETKATHSISDSNIDSLILSEENKNNETKTESCSLKDSSADKYKTDIMNEEEDKSMSDQNPEVCSLKDFSSDKYKTDIMNEDENKSMSGPNPESCFLKDSSADKLKTDIMNEDEDKSMSDPNTLCKISTTKNDENNEIMPSKMEEVAGTEAATSECKTENQKTDIIESKTDVIEPKKIDIEENAQKENGVTNGIVEPVHKDEETTESAELILKKLSSETFEGKEENPITAPS
uniref:Enolase-phosphatase E1 n=1 Tax=Timema poppense TaxID=170557 RepID=A0A7R9CTC1_TIMPO|nr:unnamed protein product [Timema poppensis]